PEIGFASRVPSLLVYPNDPSDGYLPADDDACHEANAADRRLLRPPLHPREAAARLARLLELDDGLIPQAQPLARGRGRNARDNKLLSRLAGPGAEALGGERGDYLRQHDVELAVGRRLGVSRDAVSGDQLSAVDG